MSLVGSKFVSAGAFFLFIFISGIWMNRTGRPYGMLPVTVHKFIALGMGVYLGWMVYQTHRIIPLNTVQIIAVVITVLFFIVSVATGSLLSTNNPMPEVVSFINRWFPYLTVLSTGVMIYLVG
jgi:hypothetical protein